MVQLLIIPNLAYQLELYAQDYEQRMDPDEFLESIIQKRFVVPVDVLITSCGAEL